MKSSPQSRRTLTPHPASVSIYADCVSAFSPCRKYKLLPAQEDDPFSLGSGSG